MYRRILVPTDGSRWSEHAAWQAADLARSYNAAATRLLASDVTGIRKSFLPEHIKAEMERAVLEADQRILGRAVDLFKERGVPVSARYVEGSPASVIAEEAEEGG